MRLKGILSFKKSTKIKFTLILQENPNHSDTWRLGLRVEGDRRITWGGIFKGKGLCPLA